MNMRSENTNFRLAAIAAAVAAAFSSHAMAEEVDDMTRLIKPESTIRLGIGAVNEDNNRFGQHRGLHEEGVYGLADIDVVRRDEATGTWLKIRGRNLGLDSRELGMSYGPQGNWKVFLDYREMPRSSQYVINTGLQGIGTERQTVQAANRRDVVLETKRERLSLGFQKHISDTLSARVSFTNEEKDGERLFGRGTSASITGNPNRWFNFLTEPIDSTTSQWEAVLAYAGPRFQVQGGYHGSQYSNHNTRLDVFGGGAGLNAAGAGTISPIALPPSNDAHQFFIDGGFSFTPTTRASFKVSHTKATQNDSFVGVPTGAANTSGRNRLGGQVDTTISYLSLSSRPLPKLSLLASLRYEDRDDKTPEIQYISGTANLTAGSNHDGRNEVRDYRAAQGKVEANYQLPAGYRVVLGLEEERKERNTSAVRVVSYRDHTEEATWRVELRKAMSATVNGAIAYIQSERTGSDFEVNRRFDLRPGRNFIAPIHLADRDREKIRLSADWTPVESLSFQVVAEDARDNYDSRFDLGLGARKGDSQLYSLDVAYNATAAWTINAWATHAATTSRQATAVNAPEPPISSVTGAPSAAQVNALNIWSAALVNKSDAIGLGTDLKVNAKLDVGADFEFSQDRAEYRLARERGTAPMILPNVPDIKYRTATFRFFGRYAVRKNQGFQLDLVHDRRVIDDWTWETWVYQAPTANGDGTRIRQDETQTTNFVGLSYYYKWW